MNRRKFSFAAVSVMAAAIVLMSSYVVGAAVTSAKFTGNHMAPYTKGHAAAGSDVVANGQCVTCHKTSIPGNALRGGRSAHQIHLASVFVTFGRMVNGTTKNGCVTCHTDTNSSNYLRVTGAAKNSPISYEGDVSHVGTTPDTSSNLRRNVSPAFCNRCHGKFDVATHGGSQPVGCTAAGCHQGISHSALNVSTDFVNQNIADKGPDGRCLRCHGARAWYQTTEENNADDASASQP